MRDKLDEVKFYLRRLEASDRSTEDFQHYLSAFLAAATSVPDYLLFDYAAKYLGVSQEDYIDASRFEEAAKKKGHKPALDFIKWWQSETNTIRTVGPGKILSSKRRIVIHRERPSFILTPSAPMPTGLYVMPTSSSGSFVTSPPPSHLPSIPVVQSPGEAYFLDHLQDTIVTLCQQFLRDLETYVQKAENKFP